ncbi:M24 family metallopeptidase [Candidatus Kinetoplastidibacterium galati]|uniref:M24 family metallopeptidase n=1 Tax=Candidatus Kinetoplastidibacterium galati TaxID=994695 RepID=UPI0004AF7F25|nr:M24 family metallopeptidase [Candidatus Kinetoplastibacterium galatii]
MHTKKFYSTVGMYEYELEAKLLYEFNKNGAREVSYKSIVVSAENSCALHYSKNNSIVRNGDLVLIDAGCELDNYASDITRTFPANGKFSSCQLNLYEIVLEAQKAAIEKAIAGNNFRQPHEEALKIIVQGLIDEKILNGGLDEIIETEEYKNIFPHSTSHWIGIDVHDVGNLSIQIKWR